MNASTPTNRATDAQSRQTAGIHINRALRHLLDASRSLSDAETVQDVDQDAIRTAMAEATAAWCAVEYA